MQKRFAIADGRLIETESEPAPVTLISRPDAAETKYLVEQLKIDEHTLASSLDPDEPPRLEFEPDHAAIIINWPKRYQSREDFTLRVSSLGLFLFRDRLVMVTSETDDPFDGRPLTKVGSLANVVLRIVNRATMHFAGHLKGVSMVSEELEQKINTAMENSYLLGLFSLEKSLVFYVNAIYANGMLLEKMKHSSSKIGFSPEDGELLDDITIDNNQCYKQAEIYSNVLSSLMDARASIVSNNLNVLIKVLNIITIVIMVPTFVVSAFSMNVMMPFDVKHPWAFWTIMGLAATSALALLGYWKYRKL